MRNFCKKIKNHRTIETFMWCLLISQPILDILSFFMIKVDKTIYTTLLRILMFAGIMLYAYIISNNKKPYYIMAGIMGIYWIVHIYVCSRAGYISWIEDTIMYIRTIQMPALTLAFITLIQNSENCYEKIKNAFVINFIIITASIILSYILGIPEYTYVGNIGIRGWFATGNSQSCIISVMALLGLCYAYQKKKKLVFLLVLIIEIGNLFFLGTRVAYYSIFITCISFMVFMVWNKEKEWFVYGCLLSTMVICAFGYKVSPCYVNQFYTSVAFDKWDERIENIEDTNTDDTAYLDIYMLYNEDLIERFGLEKVLEKYNYSQDAYDIISTRKQKINYSSLLMDEKDVLTHLFGYEYMEFIYNDRIYDPENDFPTLYFAYGWVGLGLYILFIVYFAVIALIDVIKRPKAVSIEKGVLATSIVLMLGIAQYSGNVLRRPNVSIYLSLMLAYIYCLCKQRNNDSCKN